jgi:transcriptional regulator with XRE-family HTH domain
MHTDKQLEQFGQRLRALRVTAGFTQEAMALEVGLDRAYCGRVERGRVNISLKNLLRISAVLRIPPSGLLACYDRAIKSKQARGYRAAGKKA